MEMIQKIQGGLSLCTVYCSTRHALIFLVRVTTPQKHFWGFAWLLKRGKHDHVNNNYCLSTPCLPLEAKSGGTMRSMPGSFICRAAMVGCLGSSFSLEDCIFLLTICGPSGPLVNSWLPHPGSGTTDPSSAISSWIFVSISSTSFNHLLFRLQMNCD